MVVLRGVEWFDLNKNEIIVKEVYNNYLNYCKYKVENDEKMDYLISKNLLEVGDIMKIKFLKGVYTNINSDIPTCLFK